MRPLGLGETGLCGFRTNLKSVNERWDDEGQEGPQNTGCTATAVVLNLPNVLNL